MIFETLGLLAEQLNIYIDQVKKPDDGIVSPIAVLQNISCLNEKMLKTTNNILLSLINIEEEQIFKNISHNISEKTTQEKYHNSLLTPNLYVLVTAVMADYENALKYLSYTIDFFKGKSIFTIQNCVTNVNGLINNFKIIIEPYSLTFEQSSSIWSSLRVGQLPFICYKVRVVPL